MPARKKKQSKLTKLLKKLNPSSPGKKLLAFVLVFAVIGGGYYLYQTFAASSSQGTTPAITCAVPRPYLKYGSSNNCVRYIQLAMNQYAGQGLNADGVFGTKTRDAVTNIQKFFNLSNVKYGEVDPFVTWPAIDAMIKPGDNGYLRAACTNFTIDGTPNPALPLSAGLEHTIRITYLNMGTTTWQRPTFILKRANGYDQFFTTDLNIEDALGSEYRSTRPIGAVTRHGESVTVELRGYLNQSPDGKPFWLSSLFTDYFGAQAGYFGPHCHKYISVQ